MSRTLLIRDETFEAQCLQERKLQMENQWVSVREIIAARVMQDVEAYYQKIAAILRNWRQHRFTERFSSSPTIDRLSQEQEVEKLLEIALADFEAKSYFVLINSVEAQSLDEIVSLDTQQVVSFLMPQSPYPKVADWISSHQ